MTIFGIYGNINLFESTFLGAGRRTRSQSLKENQEIEILPVDSEACDRSLPQKSEVSTGFTREGSHDSAISSNSSKWSVSSSISIMSCESTRTLAKKKSSILNVVEEEHSTITKGEVSDATLTWINSISPERIRSAMPVVRTGAVTNGYIVRQSVSRSVDGSETDSGCDTKMADDFLFSHYGLEVLIHLSTFLITASTVSTKVYLRVSKKEIDIYPSDVKNTSNYRIIRLHVLNSSRHLTYETAKKKQN